MKTIAAICLVILFVGFFAAIGAATEKPEAQPNQPSQAVKEILKISERIFAEANYDRASWRDCRKNFARIHADYGDREPLLAIFLDEMTEIDLAEIDETEREERFGGLLLEMISCDLKDEALILLEDRPSPTIKAIPIYLQGEEEYENGEIEKAKETFLNTFSMLDRDRSPKLCSSLADGVFSLISSDEKNTMPDLILEARKFILKPSDSFEQAVSSILIENHKAELESGDYEPVLVFAENEQNTTVKIELVKAVIRKQAEAGKFDKIEKTIDRFFPFNERPKEYSIYDAVIIPQYIGRPPCMETFAIECARYGKLKEAMRIVKKIDNEDILPSTVVNRLAGIVAGKNVKFSFKHGLVRDIVIGEYTLEDSIPRPV